MSDRGGKFLNEFFKEYCDQEPTCNGTYLYNL